MRFFILSLLICNLFQEQGLAANRKTILDIQLKSQKKLTEQILEDKVADHETLLSNLAEVESQISLIKGFNFKDSSNKLLKKKSILDEKLAQTDEEIEYLQHSIEQLTKKQISIHH